MNRLETILNVLAPVPKTIVVNGKQKVVTFTHKEIINHELERKIQALRFENKTKRIENYPEKLRLLIKKYHMDTFKHYSTKYGHLVN